MNWRLAEEDWRRGSMWAGPDSSVIDVWRLRLPPPGGALVELLTRLRPEELVRAERFHRLDDRLRFAVGRVALRERLAACLQVSARDVPLVTGANGKPELAGAAPRWEFNLSHSGNYVLLTLAWGLAIGIDVEQHRELELMELSRHVFSPDERAALAALAPEDRADAFFAVWTRKEAVLKAMGVGLGFPLDQFSVSSSPAEQPRLLVWSGAGDNSEHWRLWQLEVAAGYSATLAVFDGPASAARTVRGWDPEL
jgi:4'-phosphopantetheinyl transferase